MADDKKDSPLHLEHNGAPADLPSSTDLEQSSETASGFSFKALFIKKQNNDGFFREALDKYGYEGAISPEAEKKLVRKIDRIIIPLCVPSPSSLSFPLSVLLTPPTIEGKGPRPVRLVGRG